MRCNSHPSHPGIGVCAFCLRDRLSSLTPSQSPCEISPEHHRNPDRSNIAKSSVLGHTMRNKKTSSHVQPVSVRGMSPAAENSPGRGGVSIPSPLWRKQSARRFSSFLLCLNPMARPPETAVPGEIWGAFDRRCGGDDGGARVCEMSPVLRTNRSRKLVDLGKGW